VTRWRGFGGSRPHLSSTPGLLTPPEPHATIAANKAGCSRGGAHLVSRPTKPFRPPIAGWPGAGYREGADQPSPDPYLGRGGADRCGAAARRAGARSAPRGR